MRETPRVWKPSDLGLPDLTEEEAGVVLARFLDEPSERCADCGGEIVWHPQHGERCDLCGRPA